MSTPGPKPAPTTLKLLRGSRADRIPEAEPTPPPGCPEPPEHLGEIARDEWSRIVPILEAMGVLSQADGTALAMYCQHYERWVAAEKGIRDEGTLSVSATGNIKLSPYIQLANASMAAMQKLLVEFGCTPSSRSRVASMNATPPADELSEFLKA